MSRLEILVAGLVCGLIISLAFNVSVTWQLMKSQELYRDLSRDYDELLQSYDQLNESLSPGWIMAAKIAYTSDNEIVQVTARDLLSYPKLDLALQEAEIASSKHLAHPTEMIKLTNYEARAIVEFQSGKQANATEGMTYGFVVSYNETLYSVSMIFSWTQPIIS